MFKTLIDAFKSKDIRKKLLITLGLLVIFRLGAWIPVPGLNTEVFASYVSSEGQTFLQLMSAISGGALANGAILALGVSPYITSQIIMQLLTMAIPALERLTKQGEEGRKKITTITKYVALLLAIAQAIAITVSFASNGGIQTELFGAGQDWITYIMVVCVLVFGAMFTMWLGEKITALGTANGLSLLIFVGILSTATYALYTSFVSVFTTGNIDALWNILIFLVALLLIFFLIAFMDMAERKVPIQYAKQMKGRKMYGGQNTYVPIKVLGTGVLPIIFAMSLLSFPQIIMSIFWPLSDAVVWYSTYLGAGSWAYSIVVGFLILGFSYFINMMNFKPDDISKQIQSNGGFIPGIRPGKTTADYLAKISKRITFFGALFLMFLTIIPTLVFKGIGGTMSGTSSLVNAFSATGMIIIVSVALEIDRQLQAQLIMKNYKGFLKWG